MSKGAVVTVRCGLAEVFDGNVLSRSHEEMQLLSKMGSAMTVNACVLKSVCVYVLWVCR